MCRYAAKLGPAYQAAYYRDKLAAAEHALEVERAERRRLHKFLAEENKRTPGMVTRWVQREIAHA